MADNSYKNIEDIKVGDMVMSYDLNNDNIQTAKVTEVYHHPPREMTDYYLIINKKLHVTPNHPLYINSEWKCAENVYLGDCLFGIDGSKVKITSIEKVFKQLPTYNLEIEKTHNYFADGFLAHNAKNAAASANAAGAISNADSHHSNN